MKEIFLQILDMSISASILAGVVVLLRLVLHKAPKAIHCALWAMVALRLICPALPESQVSLMPASQPVTSVVLQESQKDPVTDAQPQLPQASVPNNVVTTPTEPEKTVDWAGILTGIWLAGVGVMALYGLGSYLYLRRKVAPSVREDGVWICDHVASPFILGLFRPRIYLPSSLEPAYRPSVLAHERAHLRRGDHWWKPLGFVLLTVHWFNPVMWLAYVLLCRDIEAACDERVVKGMEAADRRLYSEALLSCAAPRRSIAACPLAFGEQGIKGRIKSVLSYKKPTVWIILVAIVASIAVGVFFLTNPQSEDRGKQSGQEGAGTAYGVPDYKKPANPHKYNSSQIEVLRAMVPGYFEMNHMKGLEVFVWDDEGMLWCGLLPGTNDHKTQAAIDVLDAVPLSSMALILDTYEDVDDVALYVLGESEYWGEKTQYLCDGPLELWLKGQLNLVDIDIVQDISTDITTMTVKIGSKVLTYQHVKGKVWEYHLGLKITDDALYDCGFEPSGIYRYSKRTVYTVKNEGTERLIVSRGFYELISTEKVQ